MWCRRWAMVMMLMCGAVSAHAGPRDSESAVSVRIHDYSQFDAGQLQQAQREVSDTYERIGVRLDWRATVRPAEIEAGTGAWPTDGTASVTIVILCESMAARMPLAADIAGYAPITREQGGRIAFVIGPRTREIALKGQVDPSRVLAGIMTHEVAHLLMPDRSHSPGGVMRASWRPAEFRGIERQGFSKGEATSIRQTVRALSDGASRVAD